MLHKRHWPIRGTVRVIAGPIHASVLVPTVRQRRWVRCAPLLLLALAGRGLAAPVVMTAPDVEGVAAGTHPGHATQLDEAERMRRIRLDFDQTREQVFERVRRQIPDLTQAEFDRWDAAGLFESMALDGERRYFNRTASNLFRISEEARARLFADAEQVGRGAVEVAALAVERHGFEQAGGVPAVELGLRQVRDLPAHALEHLLAGLVEVQADAAHAFGFVELRRMARMGAGRDPFHIRRRHHHRCSEAAASQCEQQQRRAPDPAALPHRGHQDRSMDGTRNHPYRSPNRPVALV